MQTRQILLLINWTRIRVNMSDVYVVYECVFVCEVLHWVIHINWDGWRNGSESIDRSTRRQQQSTVEIVTLRP